ncbi:MAG: radical SAM protein [Myxococcales bacterium]|nr:radical SAM protein [Myxococcales bacterium]
MSARDQLVERMDRPQRHRLLQGFPAVPAMSAAVPVATGPLERPRRLVRSFDGAAVDLGFEEAASELKRGKPAPVPISDTDAPEQRARLEAHNTQTAARWLEEEPRLRAIVDGGRHDEAPWLNIDRTRDLIVGVIPHTQCVPRREACGFCTFPHDVANQTARERSIDAVARDVRAVGSHEALRGRPVHAVYLGGGTANLSTPDELGRLLSELRSAFVLDDAELTLEGTPALFDGWFSSHLKSLSKQAVANRRISMGVQTFDPRFLTLMGREKFGDAALVKKLARKCRDLDITTSADLLFNLPGQTLEQMEHDVDTALSAGLDQICLYHLVLYEGLGTPWSKDAALVKAMPDNRRASEHWLALRERLLRAGYEQSTLTNFERSDVKAGPKRFRYEAASFAPDRTDAIGFGPLSLTTFVDWPQRRGLKLLRRKSVKPAAWSGQDLAYRYDDMGLRLLFLTRSLATTRVELSRYTALFGTSLQEEFGAALDAARDEGLMRVDASTVSFTPLGMFYADAVVSTLAQGRTQPGGDGVHTSDLLKERPRSEQYLSMG